MAKKPVRRGDRVEVVYSDERWRLLAELRKRAVQVIRKLREHGLDAIVHGSVARGDVTKHSDVDIVIPYQVASFKVETALGELFPTFMEKSIVQATPQHAPKAHIQVDDKLTVTFPLAKLSRLECEFYGFGGVVNLEQLERGERVPGVDKRLMLIEPTDRGHLESPIIGGESIVAKKLGISVETVQQRVRVLTRRDEIGRTGVYFKRSLEDDESFEDVLKKMAERDPVIRGRLRWGA
ncbi:MAG: nucleotidyltransferase domain-containing protein [Candidatus Jordarchaeales archaeon]